MKCQVRDCDNESVTRVAIRLPERLDDTTLLAEEARNQTLEVCDTHAQLLVERNFTGLSFEPRRE